MKSIRIFFRHSWLFDLWQIMSPIVPDEKEEIIMYNNCVQFFTTKKPNSNAEPCKCRLISCHVKPDSLIVIADKKSHYRHFIEET